MELMVNISNTSYWHYDLMKENLITTVVPQFYSSLEKQTSEISQEDANVNEEQLIDSLNILCSFVEKVESELRKLPNHDYSLIQFELTMQNVMSELPELYEMLFTHFNHYFSESDQKFSDSQVFSVEEMSENFANFCKLLHRLHLISIVEDICTHMLFAQIKKKIEEDCGNNFETEFLPNVIMPWIRNMVYKWLDFVLSPTNQITSAIKGLQEQWKSRIEFHVYETFADIRISQMFDIIVDFPNSKAALSDIKLCLEETNMQFELAKSLIEAFNKRLLLPGVTTEDILEIYVLTIKALKKLDPSGALLEACSTPIAKYLKQRKDTIRCIVYQLTDESNEGLGLFEELRRSTSVVQDMMDEESDEDESKTWNPAPLHVIPGGEITINPRAQDVISMLVSIYASKELFMNEYTTILSEQLLSKTDFNTDKELRNVELLKIKFGEQSLYHAEVMLKDMVDSKRINAYVKNLKKQQAKQEIEDPLTVTIISGLFWPNLNDTSFKPPENILKMLEEFKKEYTTFKKRNLVYKSTLGSVNITLTVDGKSVDYDVSPIHACIISLFEEQPKWSLADLAAKLEINESQAQKRISYWMSNGVLQETSKGTYEVSGIATNPAENIAEAEEVEEEEEEDVEFINQLGQYIIGMCTNLGVLLPDKIHSYLTYLLPGFSKKYPDVDATVQLLEKLVKTRVLESTRDGYTLAPS